MGCLELPDALTIADDDRGEHRELEAERGYGKRTTHHDLKLTWRTGDKFSAGDVILEIETDKATMDVEAQDDGILAKIIVRLSSLTPMVHQTKT